MEIMYPSRMASEEMSFEINARRQMPKYTKLTAKNLAPLSISIFFWLKTDYFKFKYYSDDVSVSKDYFCHKFECLGMPGNS